MIYEELRLGLNNVGGDLDFVTSLRNCSKLKVLSIALNQFEGVVPNSIGNLSTKLNELYLGGNKISGMILASLHNLINLISFCMEENLLTGLIPTYFGKFQMMQGLFLWGKNLSGKIQSSTSNLTQLVDLDFSQNNLEGSITPSIGNCQNLQQLDVSQNYLSGVIPQQVFSLFSLSNCLIYPTTHLVANYLLKLAI